MNDLTYLKIRFDLTTYGEVDTASTATATKDQNHRPLSAQSESLASCCPGGFIDRTGSQLGSYRITRHHRETGSKEIAGLGCGDSHSSGKSSQELYG
jgi:hypothetical protein